MPLSFSPLASAVLYGEAADLVRHIGERKVPVVRWELGNELDRFEEKWTSKF